MKKTIRLFGVLMFCILSFTVVSCGDDDDNTGGGAAGGGDEVVTSEQFKTDLNKCGVSLISEIDTTQFVEMRDMAKCFLLNYSYHSFYKFDGFFASLLTGTLHFTSGDVADLTNLSFTQFLACSIKNFSIYRGIYEPVFSDGKPMWQKVADSENLVFKFKDDEDKDCFLSLSMSGQNSIVLNENGEKMPVDISSFYSVEMNRNGKALAKIDIDVEVKDLDLTDVNSTPSGELKVVLNASDYEFTCNAEISNTSVTTNVVVNKGSKELISIDAYVKGQGLTNINKWINDRSSIQFGASQVSVKIMNQIKVVGSVSNVREFVDLYKSCGTENYSAEQMQENADKLNNLMSLSAYSGNAKGADVKFGLTDKTSGDGAALKVLTPMMCFSDNSQISVKEYFVLTNFIDVGASAFALYMNFDKFISTLPSLKKSE